MIVIFGDFRLCQQAPCFSCSSVEVECLQTELGVFETASWRKVTEKKPQPRKPQKVSQSSGSKFCEHKFQLDLEKKTQFLREVEFCFE